VERRISGSESTERIADAGRLAGMRPMWDSGVDHVLSGDTDIEELLRVLEVPLEAPTPRATAPAPPRPTPRSTPPVAPRTVTPTAAPVTRPAPRPASFLPDEVLELVDLAAGARRRVGTYSLGMRQRLGLAAALLGAPELLILDEPMNGLDPAGVHWLRSFLRSFAEAGGTVLIASHMLAEVAQSVDQVLIIHRGRLVADARLEELTREGRTLEDVYLGLTAGGAS